MTRTQADEHLPVLDGVRGIAVLLVLLYHCLVGPTFSQVTRYGWIGVDLFFVLSGFLITGILIRSRHKEHRYLNFYARRSLRIFPLYFCSLFIVYFVLARNAQISAALEKAAPAAWYWLYSYNFYVLAIDAFATSDILDHFWSLCVEEQFYLFWPFLIFAIPQKRLPVFMVGVATIAGILRVVMVKAGINWSPIYVLTFCRMDCFAFGGLAAYANMHWDAAKIRPINGYVLSGTAVALLAYAVVYGGFPMAAPSTHIVVRPLLAIAFSSFIYFTLNPGSVFRVVNRILGGWWLVVPGKYSYGLYVYHWIVWKSLILTNTLDWSTRSAPMQFVIAASITTVCAFVSYHILEEPFLRLKKFFPTGRSV